MKTVWDMVIGFAGGWQIGNWLYRLCRWGRLVFWHYKVSVRYAHSRWQALRIAITFTKVIGPDIGDVFAKASAEALAQRQKETGKKKTGVWH